MPHDAAIRVIHSLVKQYILSQSLMQSFRDGLEMRIQAKLWRLPEASGSAGGFLFVELMSALSAGDWDFEDAE